MDMFRIKFYCHCYKSCKDFKIEKIKFQTHSEKATDEPWLEVHEQPVYSEDGSAFLLLAAVQEGGGQYYTHIKHVDVLRQRMAVLSHGKVEVAKILAWDQENHLVYYLGEPGSILFYFV